MEEQREVCVRHKEGDYPALKLTMAPIGYFDLSASCAPIVHRGPCLLQFYPYRFPLFSDSSSDRSAVCPVCHAECQCQAVAYTEQLQSANKSLLL